METVIRFFGIPLLLVLITGPLAAIFYASQLKQNHLRWLWVYLLMLALITVAEGIFIAHTFADFFPDTGCFISLLTPITAVLTIRVYRRRTAQKDKSADTTGLQDRWLLIGAILIPLLQLSAFPISYGYARTCDAQNLQAAPPIIAALQAYQKYTGSYPSDLNMLVPQYLASIPPRACVLPFLTRADPYVAARNGWSMHFCPNTAKHETYLTVPIIGSDALQVHNLDTGMWSRGSSFDGFCGQ